MASTYLTRTSSTPTLDTKFTVSAWVKGSDLGSSPQAGIFGHRSTSNNANKNLQFGIYNGGLYVAYVDSSVVTVNKISNNLFRDTSAFYHFVLSVDSTDATAEDRVKLYVNGERITSFSTNTNPSQNETFLSSSCNIDVGRFTDTGGTHKYWNGSMAHVHFIDGTAYSPSDFGETDATTGIWKPKTAPSVTYGTNGFFLKFENSGAFGTDSSGNGNNFTVNGTMTQTIDTPSNVFATFNPLFGAETMAVNSTFSNGNTSVVNSGAVYNPYGTTLGVSSGKYYAEFKANANMGDGNIGIFAKLGSSGDALGSQTQQYSWYFTASDGNIRSGGSNIVTSVGTVSANDIIGIALDCDNNKLYFHKNGTYISNGTGTGNPSTGTNGISITDPDDTDLGFYFMTAMDWGGSTRGNWSANFGNGYFGTTAVSSAENPDDGIGIFEYSVPTGYKALCTKSINSQEYD